MATPAATQPAATQPAATSAFVIRPEASSAAPTQPTTQSVDAAKAIKALAACDGNTMQAARLLGVSDVTLLHAIVSDETSHEILSRMLRVFAITKVFSTLGEVHTALSDAISQELVASRDLVRLQIGLLDQLHKLTDTRANMIGPDGTVSPAQRAAKDILAALPDHIRSRVTSMIQNTEEDNTGFTADEVAEANGDLPPEGMSVDEILQDAGMAGTA